MTSKYQTPSGFGDAKRKFKYSTTNCFDSAMNDKELKNESKNATKRAAEEAADPDIPVDAGAE